MFEDFSGEDIEDHDRRFGSDEKTLGDVFDDYSDPEAPPLTQLPPKHLMYYNLGIKMPGELIDEEPTPRSDEEDEALPKDGEDDDPEVKSVEL